MSTAGKPSAPVVGGSRIEIRARSVPHWGRVALALFAVGWGANQFVPMLLLYRKEAPLSNSVADSLFAAYAFALIPALFLGGYLSDRFGRGVIIPGVCLSLCASVTLMVGDTFGTAALVTGRILAGLASGLVFAPGSAWVKELSVAPSGVSTPGHVGARRAAIAMTAGFALGPVCTGLLVQIGPWRWVLPYAPHLVLATTALLLLTKVPRARARPVEVPNVLPEPNATTPKSRRTLWISLLLVAPWVFGAPSLVAVVVPAVLRPNLDGNEYLYSGLLIGATMLIGVAIQPWAGRLEGRQPGTTDVLGLLCVTVGVITTVTSATSSSVAFSLLSACALGLGYSVCLVGGLTSMQRIAPPARLGLYTALFYAASYTGFGLPLLLTALQHLGLDLRVCLVALATAAGLTAALLERQRRRQIRHQSEANHPQ